MMMFAGEDMVLLFARCTRCCCLFRHSGLVCHFSRCSIFMRFCWRLLESHVTSLLLFQRHKVMYVFTGSKLLTYFLTYLHYQSA